MKELFQKMKIWNASVNKDVCVANVEDFAFRRTSLSHIINFKISDWTVKLCHTFNLWNQVGNFPFRQFR